VAIKLLHLFVARDPEQRRRFEREARMLAGLDSEHVVRVYDYIDTGDQAFLVMEYVDGGNLAETTFGRLPLDVGEAAWYARAVAEPLTCAHRKGVIHRDLTPANILIERDTARVVTTDFGLARAVRSAGSFTGAGVLLGTPEYWSPEQAIGREQDAASDIAPEPGSRTETRCGHDLGGPRRPVVAPAAAARLGRTARSGHSRPADGGVRGGSASAVGRIGSDAAPRFTTAFEGRSSA
jgi:serine/threonine protein kinase